MADEVLTLDFSAGAMPTGNTCESITTEDVTVKTGDVAYSVKSQTFTGTPGQTISVTGTPDTVVKSQTFAGESGQTVNVEGSLVNSVYSATFGGN